MDNEIETKLRQAADLITNAPVKSQIDSPSLIFVHFLESTEENYSNFELRCQLAATQTLLKLTQK